MNELFLLLLICIGIGILLFIVYEGGRLYVYGQRSVRMGKETQCVSQKPQHPKQRILVIGDSTAYGTGARDTKNSLVGRLATDYPDAEIVNESENSMTIKRLFEKLDQIPIEDFHIIIMHIGGMDVLALSSIPSVCTYLNKIYTLLKNRHHGITILVSMNNVGAPPLMRFPLDLLFDARSMKLSKALATECSNYGIVHVPLYTALSNDPLHTDPKRFFAEDYMHPNDEGYGIWYLKIKEAIHPHMS